MPPSNDRGRPTANQAAPNVINGDDLSISLDGFTAGILADAFREGQRQFWLKRAADFERAKPKLGEFHGNATPEELNRRWRWCDGIANACRAKAIMVGLEDEFERLVDDLGRAQ